MVENKDEVRGLDRYLPTSRSRILFWAIPTSVAAIFWQSPKLVNTFFTSLPKEYSWLGSAFLVVSDLAFVSLLLVFELCAYANQENHKVVRHYKYYAPEMNVKWLFTNARLKHYLFLFIIFISGVITGHFL